MLLAPATSIAKDAASPQQLKELRQRISHLQKQHERDLKKRDELSHTLQQQDKRVAELSREKRQLQDKQEKAKAKLEDLEKQQRKMASEKDTQITWLKKTAQALFLQGREPKTKLLLSQEKPDQISRLLRYHDYFNRARKQRVDDIKKELEELLALAREVRSARADYQEKEQAVAHQQKHLTAAQENRKKALANLNSTITSQKDKIGRLQEDAQRLDGMLEDMNEDIADVPKNPSGTPFAQLKGRLPWPAKGRIKASYNSKREGNIRWSGVLLDVPDGTPVKAIHAGRVTYSDWVQGYGLITIIDHGNDYLSLYGHNETLLKDVGEWVESGDVIALAGNSGSADRAGVYLEIRKDGRTQNPSAWCQ